MRDAAAFARLHRMLERRLITNCEVTNSTSQGGEVSGPGAPQSHRSVGQRGREPTRSSSPAGELPGPPAPWKVGIFNLKTGRSTDGLSGAPQLPEKKRVSLSSFPGEEATAFVKIERDTWPGAGPLVLSGGEVKAT